jgi:hypothetical protein
MNDNFIEYNVPITVDRGMAEGNEEYVIFEISNEEIDSHDTIFMLDGWDLSYAKRNPVVTYGHPDLSSTDDTLYIGRHEVYIEDRKLMAKVYFNKENPRSVRVEKAVRSGFLNMASIRAYIDDYEVKSINDKTVLVFTKQRLFDFGIVPHGSNPNAFVQKREMLISKKVQDDPKMDQEEDRLLINKLKNRIKVGKFN